MGKGIRKTFADLEVVKKIYMQLNLLLLNVKYVCNTIQFFFNHIDSLNIDLDILAVGRPVCIIIILPLGYIS